MALTLVTAIKSTHRVAQEHTHTHAYNTNICTRAAAFRATTNQQLRRKVHKNIAAMRADIRYSHCTNAFLVSNCKILTHGYLHYESQTSIKKGQTYRYISSLQNIKIKTKMRTAVR